MMREVSSAESGRVSPRSGCNCEKHYVQYEPTAIFKELPPNTIFRSSECDEDFSLRLDRSPYGPGRSIRTEHPLIPGSVNFGIRVDLFERPEGFPIRKNAGAEVAVRFLNQTCACRSGFFQIEICGVRCRHIFAVFVVVVDPR